MSEQTARCRREARICPHKPNEVGNMDARTRGRRRTDLSETTGGTGRGDTACDNGDPRRRCVYRNLGLVHRRDRGRGNSRRPEAVG